MLIEAVEMDKVIPWYKMYDFVKSQPQDREIQSWYLILEYLFHFYGVVDIKRQPDSTLSKWQDSHQLQDTVTFDQIKESMDNYMDDQFRESGFEVYLPC